MQDYIDDIAGRWIAQAIGSDPIRLNGVPALIIINGRDAKGISVRCVGRTEKAPLRGYIRDEITNADVLGLSEK